MFAGIRGQLSTVVRSFSLLEAFRSYLSRSLKCSLRKTSSNSPISSSEGTDLALGLDMRRTAGISEIFSRSSSTASHAVRIGSRSEEHTSELQSRGHLVCRLLLEK